MRSASSSATSHCGTRIPTPRSQRKRRKLPAPRAGSGDDLLFEQQQHLDEQHLLGCATTVGLDLPRFRNEMRDHVYVSRVQECVAGGRRLGVRSTPAFFVNGVFADVSFGMQHLHEAIDRALATP